MFQKFKMTVVEMLSNPNTRTILILGTLLIAALAGGAPTDHGGG
jgi:hypothetical protein